MQLLIMCDPGAGKACAQEAKANNLTILTTRSASVLAQGRKEEIAHAIWHGQTMLDALLVLQDNATLDNLNASAWPKEAQEIIETTKTFAVQAKNADPSLSLHDQHQVWGGAIKPLINKEVDLDKPEVLFVPYEEEGKITLGLSLAKKDLRKREYRIFTSNKSLRSTIAASALRLAGYSGKEDLLLPYENDGTLAIEAALMATNLSPYRYEGGLALQTYWPQITLEEEEREAQIDVVVPTVPFLKAVQKNAKIAGVKDNIAITKAELDWLDTKYDEKSKGLIIATLPSSGKKMNEKESAKIADELAYQARYVLKKGGKISILTLKPQEQEARFLNQKFKEVARHELMMGEQQMWLITMEVA